jgi:hypothetical protein
VQEKVHVSVFRATVFVVHGRESGRACAISGRASKASKTQH